MPLASISTGIIVTENAAGSMLEAKINGINEMGKFISNRLQPGKTVSFFDPIKRSNTMTFGTIKKKRTSKIKNKVMSIESSKDLFSKISLIAQSRNIKIRDLFAFPLGAVPLVFAEIEGTLKKTPKSALLHKLEADIPPVEDVPLNNAMIIDGMTLVRQIRTSKMTFEEFAIKLLRHVLSIGQNSERIDVAFDVYRDSSIKDIERNRRSSGNLTLQQTIPTSPIKQWNLLLSSNHNKNMLVKFAVDQWKTKFHVLERKVLLIKCGTKAYRITSE